MCTKIIAATCKSWRLQDFIFTKRPGCSKLEHFLNFINYNQMNHWLRICRHSNPMLATKFAVYFWHDIPLIMFSITSFKFSLSYFLCTVIFQCFIIPTRQFYIVTVCPILCICRREYWAGPQQQLYFNGSQVKIGGMYTFSCRVKLRNKTPKPQTFRIRIASTLQSELLLYLLFQLCACQRSEQKFSPVVFGIAEVLLALKTQNPQTP